MKTHRNDDARKSFSLALTLAATIGASIFADGSIFAQTRQRPTSAPVKRQAPQADPNAASQPKTTGDAPQFTPEEETKYNEALECFNRQDVGGALKALQELTANNPAARPPRLIMARWFMELKNVQAMRASFELATEESPEDPEAYYCLAETALSDGELTATELLVRKGDELLAKYNANPTRKKSMIELSYKLKLAYADSRKRWPEAQEAILGLIKLNGETAELDRAYARVLFQQEQDDKARETFQRADKIAKGEGLPAEAAMAQLYASRGDAANAKRSLDAALKSYPTSTPVLLLSIADALGEGNLDAAWSLVQKLYQTDKGVDVLKTYGKVALFRSDYVKAEAAFQEAVRQSPLDAEATSGLALALCEQEDKEKRNRAVQYAAGNLQKQARNRDFLATFGWTLYKAGQLEDAMKVLQQSAADGQVNAASAYYLAVILNEKGQKDAAIQLLKAALSTEPPFVKRAEATKLLSSLESGAQK